MATHDINLAARFSDRIILMLGEGRPVTGPVTEVLTCANLALAFECEFTEVSNGEQRYFFPV